MFQSKRILSLTWAVELAEERVGLRAKVAVRVVEGAVIVLKKCFSFSWKVSVLGLNFFLVCKCRFDYLHVEAVRLIRRSIVYKDRAEVHELLVVHEGFASDPRQLPVAFRLFK